jgi:hypothetical protein
MNRASLFALFGTALVVGCGSIPMKTINIDSDPQGSRVEMNGEDLGKTPTSIAVKTNPEGEFLGSWAGAPVVEFTAFPPPGSTGLYKQTKTFMPNGFFKAGDRIPAKMFFDLHEKSEQLQINLPAK